MATLVKNIALKHIVEKESDVRLTITIGNMQIGGSRVKWQGVNQYLAKGKVTNLLLGKGRDLIDKVLIIATNFYDSSEYSNNISAIYDFNNGNPPLHVYYDQVPNNGDFAVFNIEVTFK